MLSQEEITKTMDVLKKKINLYEKLKSISGIKMALQTAKDNIDETHVINISIAKNGYRKFQATFTKETFNLLMPAISAATEETEEYLSTKLKALTKDWL